MFVEARPRDRVKGRETQTPTESVSVGRETGEDVAEEAAGTGKHVWREHTQVLAIR